MHILRNREAIDSRGHHGFLPPGKWLMHDTNAFEYGMLAPRGTTDAVKFDSDYAEPNDKPVLIMRSGAIGDLLLMSPAIAQWRKDNPDTKVALSCFKSHHQIFANTGLFDALHPYPLEAEWVGEFSRIISLENVIELSSGRHATDAFADALGVIVTDYRPTYCITESERMAAKLRWEGQRPRVGLQLRASGKNRDYPAYEWGMVISGLEKRGWEVLILGSPGQIPPLPAQLQSPYIRDLSNLGLTLRESVAALAQCHAFCGVDSSMLHFCHALNVPAIGLFAAIDWRLRTAKAPLTKVLTGVADCAPCGWSLHARRHFPPGKPCSEKQICVALATIPPERIIAKIDGLHPLRKK